MSSEMDGWTSDERTKHFHNYFSIVQHMTSTYKTKLWKASEPAERQRLADEFVAELAKLAYTYRKHLGMVE